MRKEEVNAMAAAWAWLAAGLGSRWWSAVGREKKKGNGCEEKYGERKKEIILGRKIVRDRELVREREREKR